MVTSRLVARVDPSNVLLETLIVAGGPCRENLLKNPSFFVASNTAPRKETPVHHPAMAAGRSSTPLNASSNGIDDSVTT